jgi:oligopeptide transport system ATP-binding protein
MALLEVEDLVVRFRTHDATVHAVNGVSFELNEGETLGLVGESGCGKSVTSLAIMRLLPRPAGRIEGGRVTFDGQELTALTEAEMRDLRGRELAMIFQDPMTSLNPVLTIEEQMVETIRAHTPLTAVEARERAVELLGMVGIPQPRNRLGDFPHQFSGGMRQRVMIAMGLALRPKLLIADEPTTALDVTIQAQVLELLRELTAQGRTAAILITHDLGVVAGMTQRINVMYAGYIVETASTPELFAHPSHPYTVGLLHSIPRLDAVEGEPLIPIEGAPPDQRQAPVGCPFAPRCAWRLERCWSDNPALAAVDGAATGEAAAAASTGHRIACHNPPTPREAELGRPDREGFQPAPPPSTVIDELGAVAGPEGEAGIALGGEELIGPEPPLAGEGAGMPLAPGGDGAAEHEGEHHHPRGHEEGRR